MAGSLDPAYHRQGVTVSSSTSVSIEIADCLLREIMSGQYRVGERMPSERDLSARFGVSRGAVREALSQLGQQGIIDIQPGGVRVKRLEEASLAVLGPLLALEPIPDPSLVDQFLEIFSVLTVLTVKRALEQADSEQMIQLKKMLVDMSHSAKDPEAMRPHWEAMLDYMAGINNNLVARLIGNDLKAQIIGQMMQLHIQPSLPANSGPELVVSLREAFDRKDGNAAAAAFEKNFNELRLAMGDALEAMRGSIKQQVV